MTKDNILFSIIGVLLGFIVGFMFANSVNRGSEAQRLPAAGGAAQTAGLPADHPPVMGGQQADPQVMENVQAAIRQAREQPDDFDAQMRAAEMYFQVQRFEQATEFLERAHQLRPDNYGVIVNLGNAHLETSRFAEAERWYSQALQRNADDVNVRAGLGITFLFRNPPDVERAIREFRTSLERDPRHKEALQYLVVALTRNRDATEAQAALARLTEADPQNPLLPRLRADIEALRAPAGSSSPARATGAGQS